MKSGDSVEPTLTDLMVAMKDGFAAVDARFDAVDERFAAVDARFDAVDERFAGIDAQLVTIDARFDAMDTQFAQIDKQLIAIVDRADNTDARISDLQEDGKKIRKHLFDIEDKLDTLCEVVDKDSLTLVQHEERISSLEAQVA